MTFPELVKYQLERARKQHPPTHSLAEGLAIILEEFEEFKAEVFRKQANPVAVLDELSQLGAMAQRTAEDCGLLEKSP